MTKTGNKPKQQKESQLPETTADPNHPHRPTRDHEETYPDDSEITSREKPPQAQQPALSIPLLPSDLLFSHTRTNRRRNQSSQHVDGAGLRCRPRFRRRRGRTDGGRKESMDTSPWSWSGISSSRLTGSASGPRCFWLLGGMERSAAGYGTGGGTCPLSTSAPAFPSVQPVEEEKAEWR